MSVNSTNTLTGDVDADVDVDLAKTTFVSHSVRKPEYKEYAFQAERNAVQNVNIKNKVAEFWEVIDTNNYAAPKSTLFKPKFIRECVDVDTEADDDTSVEGSTIYNEDDKKRLSLMNQKWTHTLCLFKKRGLDKLAFAARPKLCNRCDTKFSLKYSDEVCDTFVADYGQQESSSDMASSSY